MTAALSHFEELDWLDYAQGLLAAEEKAALESHLVGCDFCTRRLASLRCMAGAIPRLQEIREPTPPIDEDRAFVARAAQTADETNEAIGRARLELEPSAPLAPDRVPTLSEHHVAAALQLARDFFAIDFARSQALIEWASQALNLLSSRGSLAWPGLHGAVGSCLAYLRFRGGETTAALADLDASRILLKAPMPLHDLEIAFSSYVRASCLHNLSRFEEALEEIKTAEEIYAAFGDGRRLARSRFLHAILLFDGGQPETALPLQEVLLGDKNIIDDLPIYALLHLSYANNLVFTGSLERAKTFYAKAAVLLKKTNQEDQLFRVRVGLADIAQREGRIRDALALNVELRSEFRKRHLPWDEVRRELWIVRELLELERFADAGQTCKALAQRAQELSLSDEALRALAYLADAERALTIDRVAEVEERFRRIARGSLTDWPAA